MDGPNCLVHSDTPMWLLSTFNQWKYYCPKCDRRYNEEFVPMRDADYAVTKEVTQSCE